MEQKQLLQQMVLGDLDSYVQKNVPPFQNKLFYVSMGYHPDYPETPKLT